MNPDSYETLVAEPAGANEKAAHEEPQDSNGARQGEDGCKREVESPEYAVRREKADPEPHRDVIEGDQREGAEAPEDKGMREPWQWALANHFRLAEDFGKELPDPPPEGRKMEAGILFRFENEINNSTEASPEKRARSDDQNG